MKTFKKVALTVGLLLLAFLIWKGYPIAQKFYKHYQFKEALTGTVFDTEISPESVPDFDTLSEGAIVATTPFELSDVPPIWEQLSDDNTLKEPYQYLEQIDFSLVVYKSDTLLVNAIQAEPKEKGVYPAIIYNRGGNQLFGKDAKGRTFYNLLQVAQLAETHVVLAPCYREQDEFGGRDLQDVLNLIETAKSLPNVDSSRIGMAGWSRGGMMTYMALKHSDAITTAVVINGPTDLPQLLKERPVMEKEVCAKLIPAYETHKSAALHARSAQQWPEALDKDASILLICGTQDTRVNPAQARKMHAKLTAIDYDVTFKEFDTDHSFSGKNDVIQHTLVSWFHERL